MKPLTKDSKGLKIEVICSPEDVPIEGNASAIDPVTDAETVSRIKRQLRHGNEWAWCQVQVRVTYRDVLEASDYLGCCSYDSEDDFRRPGGYFDDMVAECIRQLNEQRAKVCA